MKQRADSTWGNLRSVPQGSFTDVSCKYPACARPSPRRPSERHPESRRRCDRCPGAADTVPERRVFRIPGAGGFQPAAQSISGYDGCPLWEGPGDLCQKCFVGPLRFFDPLVKRRKILLVFAKCHANGFIDEISHGTSRIERLEAQSAVKFGVPSRPIWHHNVMLSMHHNVT